MKRTNLNFANALYHIALEKNQVVQFKDEAILVLDLFESNSNFIKLLDCQFIDINKRYEVVDAIFKDVLNLDFLNFIKVLILSHFINNIVQILNNFIDFCNQNLNIRKGIIYSVNKLDHDTIESLSNVLSNKIGYQLYFENKIDSSLIGGLKIAIDGHIYDNSLKYQLHQLHQHLISKKEL